jgi:hypothetical protein
VRELYAATLDGSLPEPASIDIDLDCLNLLEVAIFVADAYSARRSGRRANQGVTSPVHFDYGRILRDKLPGDLADLCDDQL